jgi:hypothetical protein
MLRIRLAMLHFILLFPGNARRQADNPKLSAAINNLNSLRVFLSPFHLTVNKYSFFSFFFLEI